MAPIVMGLILMGCGGSATALTVPVGAKPGEFTIKPCMLKSDVGAYAADCGTLVVPENRAKVNSRLIAAPAERAAEELLPSLSKGQQMILAEMSHDDLPGLDSQPRAAERLIISFYDTGMDDGSLYSATPLDFRVSWGYPVLAKTGFGLVLLSLTTLLGVIWLIIRQVRRPMVLRRQLSVAQPGAEVCHDSFYSVAPQEVK